MLLFAMSSTQRLQLNLALDEILKNDWSIISEEFEALDKASRVRNVEEIKEYVQNLAD